MPLFNPPASSHGRSRLAVVCYWLAAHSEAQDDEQVDPFDQPASYLLVQREFEGFNGGKCYIESHDEEYIGHFKLKLVEFSPARLSYEIARPEHKLVEVFLALTAGEFEKAQPIIEVIFGLREPCGGDHIGDNTLQSSLLSDPATRVKEIAERYDVSRATLYKRVGVITPSKH